MTAHIVYETTGGTLLSENRLMSAFVDRLHLMVTDGAGLSGDNQSALTNPLAIDQAYVNELDAVLITTVNYGPEKTVPVTLLVITRPGKIGFACGQHSKVTGNGD